MWDVYVCVYVYVYVCVRAVVHVACACVRAACMVRARAWDERIARAPHLSIRLVLAQVFTALAADTAAALGICVGSRMAWVDPTDGHTDDSFVGGGELQPGTILVTGRMPPWGTVGIVEEFRPPAKWVGGPLKWHKPESFLLRVDFACSGKP